MAATSQPRKLAPYLLGYQRRRTGLGGRGNVHNGNGRGGQVVIADHVRNEGSHTAIAEARNEEGEAGGDEFEHLVPFEVTFCGMFLLVYIWDGSLRAITEFLKLKGPGRFDGFGLGGRCHDGGVSAFRRVQVLKRRKPERIRGQMGGAGPQ